MSAAVMLASAYSTASAAVSVAATVSASVAATAAAGATHSVPATGGLESIVTSLFPSMVASALPSAVTTTAPLSSQPIFLPAWFEMLAIFAGGLAGGIRAVERRFDLIGVLVLALVNGLGGGILRDLLLQDYGIFALRNPRALGIVVLAAIVASFFTAGASRLNRGMVVVDALSLGLFCLVGSDKALVAGLAIGPAILLGVVTASGGGVIRDILCATEPEVLRKGTLSATAAIAGSSVFVLLVTWLNFSKPYAMLAGASVALVLRVGSLWLGWESPEPVDLTDAVVGAPRRMLSRRPHDPRKAGRGEREPRDDD